MRRDTTHLDLYNVTTVSNNSYFCIIIQQLLISVLISVLEWTCIILLLALIYISISFTASVIFLYSIIYSNNLFSEYTPEMVNLKCKSGNSVSSTTKCLYNIDKYGYMTGCRDATHLEDCGRLCL